VASFSSLLAGAIASAGVTQVELSAVTGVSQGRISEYVHQKREMSERTARLLFGAMGWSSGVVATAQPASMNVSERRSWRLHRKACAKLTAESLPQWRELIAANSRRMRGQIEGHPHVENLDRWVRLAEAGDIRELRAAMLDPGERGRAMREVSPLAGVLTQRERCEALGVDYVEAL
jgi:transcriptional regulator with XRE-family HTH domain